jgi:hypothetical protein
LETPDKVIVEENYVPEHMFNMDETSLLRKRMLERLSSIRRPSKCLVSRFVLSTPMDVRTTTKSPNDAFLRTYPRR